MIALYIIGQGFVAAAIVTAGAIWIVGSVYGLRAAVTPYPTDTTKPDPDPPPRLPEPRKWACNYSGAPVLLWPHGN